MEPYKFASFDKNDWHPFQYPNLYSIYQTTGRDRLDIAPREGHIDLMISLLEFLPEPLCLLYVLLVSRTGAKEGRYQSPFPITRAEAISFLSEHRAFFENDARHNIWVLSNEPFQSLIYDRHNILYCYGPIEKYLATLRKRGFKQGDIRIPVPHSHSYNPEFDIEEAAVVNQFQWKHFPLQPEHDV